MINSIGKFNQLNTFYNLKKKWIFLGQYGPAVALFIAAYTGCDKWLTVGLLTLGVGLNGGIYSGFKVNHLDISPQFAGILMSFTNCMANLAGLLAPIYAGYMVKGTVSCQSLLVFFWD